MTVICGKQFVCHQCTLYRHCYVTIAEAQTKIVTKQLTTNHLKLTTINVPYSPGFLSLFLYSKRLLAVRQGVSVGYLPVKQASQ